MNEENGGVSKVGPKSRFLILVGRNVAKAAKPYLCAG